MRRQGAPQDVLKRQAAHAMYHVRTRAVAINGAAEAWAKSFPIRLAGTRSPAKASGAPNAE